MKIQPSPRAMSKRGLTLIELTVVILVLLSLIVVLFIGARGWKQGTDRAGCILKIRAMQMATRSYQNLYGFNPGSLPYASGGTQFIAQHLLEKGYIKQGQYDNATGDELCPSNGTYSTPFPDTFPLVGNLYMTCSLSDTQNHIPQTYADW